MSMIYFRKEDILHLTNKLPKSDRNHCLCKGHPLFNKKYKTRKPQQFLVFIMYVYLSQKIVDNNTTTVNSSHGRGVMYLDYKSKGRRFDPTAGNVFFSLIFVTILTYNFSSTAQNNFPIINVTDRQICVKQPFNLQIFDHILVQMHYTITSNVALRHECNLTNNRSLKNI